MNLTRTFIYFLFLFNIFSTSEFYGFHIYFFLLPLLSLVLYLILCIFSGSTWIYRGIVSLVNVIEFCGNTSKSKKTKQDGKLKRKPTVSQNMTRTCRTIVGKYRRDRKLGKLLRLKNMMSNLTFRIQRDLLHGFVVNALCFIYAVQEDFLALPLFFFFKEKRFSLYLKLLKQFPKRKKKMFI